MFHVIVYHSRADTEWYMTFRTLGYQVAQSMASIHPMFCMELHYYDMKPLIVLLDNNQVS